ncbi:beta-lactamase regulating signal transducer with metallopeptidase domain [Anaerotaenia torta]|uniref:DUF5301 domain-containing protein n=1 Tax=Anaerotaenia torta TaxID=433293 RepID=UPI003D1DED98
MTNLQGMFTTVLNMSITASYVAVGIIFIRLLLKKAPKIFSYVIWAVLLFRLICPFSFSTSFSFLGLLNVKSQNGMSVLEYVPRDIGAVQAPATQNDVSSLDSPYSPDSSDSPYSAGGPLPRTMPIASANPVQIWMDALSLIWLAGMVILFCSSVILYVKTKRRLLTATLVRGNIYESDRIGTALVCGLLHPKIYVPLGAEEPHLSYILEHERTHIRRRDYLIKPLAFLTLLLHWFNPLMWLSFALMSRDMEMSCDESVLHRMGRDARGGYSSSLLSLSVKASGLFAANPLAFGESHVKVRIKNVLNYKKPVFWMVIASVIVLSGAGIAFLTNPIGDEQDLSFLKPGNLLSLIGEQDQVKIESSKYGNTFISGREFARWLDTAENQWTIVKVVSHELSPSIIIHVNDEVRNEIHFFTSDPAIAKVVYQDEYRYYKIPEEDYSAIAAMAELSYPNIQSITFTEQEGGNINEPVNITDSMAIMRMAVLMQSGGKYRPSLLFDSTQNDVPPVPDYIRVEMSGDEAYASYFLYTEDEKSYYIDRPYDHINKIDFDTLQSIITILTDNGNGLPQDQIGGDQTVQDQTRSDQAEQDQVGQDQNAQDQTVQDQNGFDVESNLSVIMSSPKTSSNPQDYIRAHDREYEEFFKYGGEDALQYMLAQFEAGNAEGLRGQIMMLLCKELLGVRNNVTDETLSPQEWYDALSIRQEIILPNYQYDGQDSVEKLVYAAEIEKNSDSERGGFMVVAPRIFGSYEEGDRLKVFVTTYHVRYKLFGNVLSEEGGSIIPAAITYVKDDSGSYILEEYQQAGDGSEFGPSIRKYCTMPVSGEEIKGLANKILEGYSDFGDIQALLQDNLRKHLKKHGITDVEIEMK